VPEPSTTTEEGQYGEESDPDDRHPEASRGGDRRRSGDFQEAGGDHSERYRWLDRQTPEEGRAHPHRRSRHPASPQTRRAYGPQSGHRRSDPDQGVEEGRFPRRQGAEGSNLISAISA